MLPVKCKLRIRDAGIVKTVRRQLYWVMDFIIKASHFFLTHVPFLSPKCHSLGDFLLPGAER